MAKKYRMKKGEHIRTVARRFGFASLKPIADEPANAEVIAGRGGDVEKIRNPDRSTIPAAKSGKRKVEGQVAEAGRGGGRDRLPPSAHSVNAAPKG